MLGPEQFVKQVEISEVKPGPDGELELTILAKIAKPNPNPKYNLPEIISETVSTVTYKKNFGKYIPEFAAVQKVIDLDRSNRTYKLTDRLRKWAKDNPTLETILVGDYTTIYTEEEKPNSWDRLPDFRLRSMLRSDLRQKLETENLLPPRGCNDIEINDDLYGMEFRWKKNPITGKWSGRWDFAVTQDRGRNFSKNYCVEGTAKLTVNGDKKVKAIYNLRTDR